MESLRYNCVTSSRDNIDNVPGNHTENAPNDVNFLNRWKVGFDRMLIAALGVTPFFDNTWSIGYQPESTWGSNGEGYTELSVALSILGAGGVGIGDMLGYENVSLIMTTVSADGTLLSPSRSSTYIDAVYLPSGTQAWNVSQGRILQAPSFIPSMNSSSFTLEVNKVSDLDNTFPVYMSVLSIDVSTTVALSPQAFYPDLSFIATNTTGEYAVLAWSPGFTFLDSACSSGTRADACVSLFSPVNPLVINTGVAPVPYEHNFELHSLSPIYASGWALIGELAKFVRVSNQRFVWINGGDGSSTSFGLDVGVRGTANEVLSLAVYAPGPIPMIIRVPIVFATDSIVTVHCEGFGATAQCTVF